MYLQLLNLGLDKIFSSNNHNKDNCMTSLTFADGTIDTCSLVNLPEMDSSSSALEDIVIVKKISALETCLNNTQATFETDLPEQHCCSSHEMAKFEKESSSNFCRICLEGENRISSRIGISEKLISPCNCTGTLAKIHKSCLEQWLSSSNTTKCEICRFVYITRQVPPSFKDCLNDPGNAFYVRNLLTDFLCFALLSPVLAISIYLCFLGANKYYLEFSGTGQSIGLIILIIFLILVYCIWIRVTHKYHTTIWRSWRASHSKIKLVLTT